MVMLWLNHDGIKAGSDTHLDVYKRQGYTTDNYAKEQQLGPKYVQLYEQFIPIYADFDNLMHKINTCLLYTSRCV